ncbi:MAG: MFS transporter [Candidatus Nanopelagicales bacterium]
MTPAQKRITLAISVIVGLSLLVVTGLTFLTEPMVEELGLSDDAVERALITPTIASLLVVFIAGRAGDRFGQRRTIGTAAVVFTAGAAVLAVAQAEIGVILGLALCGVGAVVIQVVALSLLQRTAPEGKAHASAFTTYGMVFPLAFLLLPIGTAFLLALVNWRWIPVIWAIAGIVIIVTALSILDRGEERRGSVGDWISPILAGVALTAGTQVLDELGERPANGRVLLIGGALCAGAIVSLIVVMRRTPHPGFSLRPIGGAMLRPLMIGVALLTLIQILTYVSISMEYLYEMTPLQASLAIAPAQLGAILGAKLVAAWAVRRWGVERSGRSLLLATGVVMLLLVVMQASTPAWYLVLVSTLFSLTGMAALTILNLDIMGRAPADSTGAVSAFRMAASSVGSALSMAVLGVVVLSSVTMSAGVSAVGEAELTGLASGLRIDGVLGFAIALVGWVLLSASYRRNQANSTIGDSRAVS